MAFRQVRKCFPVINNIKKESFPLENEKAEDVNFESLEFTSIWKKPERLKIESDYSLLFATLSRKLLDANYAEVLLIMKIMKMSVMANDGINDIIDKMFSYLLLQILREEHQKKIDLHLILDWLDAGDRLFRGNGVILTEKSYAVLKLYYLCRNIKAKFECFSCGCIQKYFIELYTDNARLNEALVHLIKPQLSSICFHPIIQRIFHSTVKIPPIDYYGYYIELLEELQNCFVIGKHDEKSLSRMVQLLGLLCELNSEDTFRACEKLNNLIELHGIKRSTTMETVLRSRLLPKIFDIVSSNGMPKLEMKRKSIFKIVELVANEKYSYVQEAKVFFSPLQLLNRIYSEYDAFKKTWPIIKNRLESLKMESPQSPIFIIYVLSLIYRNDASLINILVEFLEAQYGNATIDLKKTILFLLEVVEKLSETSRQNHAFFSECRLKNKLILDSELEIVLDYLDEFTEPQVNEFLQHRTCNKTMSDDDFQFLLGSIKNLRVSISSDGFWKQLLIKINEDSMIFIKNQLKILAERQEKKELESKIDQILQRIRIMHWKEPSMEIAILKFPKILLDLCDSQILLTPANFNSLFSLLILGYAAFFEGNESNCNNLFSKFFAKINSSALDASTWNSSPEIIGDICKNIKLCTGSSISFLHNDTVISQISEIYESNISAEKKERVVELCSILFENLAGHLQKFGDRGKTPFCQLVIIIVDKYVKSLEKEEIIPNFELYGRVCERTLEGFTMMTERWNFLFLSAKVLTILNSAKKEMGLCRKLMRIICKNETLLSKLRAKKEFLQLEQFTDS